MITRYEDKRFDGRVLEGILSSLSGDKDYFLKIEYWSGQWDSILITDESEVTIYQDKIIEKYDETYNGISLKNVKSIGVYDRTEIL